MRTEPPAGWLEQLETCAADPGTMNPFEPAYASVSAYDALHCRNPEYGHCPSPIYAKGRCRACYAYRKRTGTERPEDVIVAHNRRRFDEAELHRLVRREM